MSRRSLGFTVLMVGALVFFATATQAGDAMKATAPEHMTPSGESKVMLECDKLAVNRHVKMEERTRFVQKCITLKMKK